MPPDPPDASAVLPGLAPLSEPPADALGHARIVQTWVAEYLCQPHRDLGREGPVCPLTRPSLDRNLFWASYDERHHLSVDDVCEAVLHVRDQLGQLPPADGPDAVLKAALIVFPFVTDYLSIATAQRRMKSQFVGQGLMLGQFYPGCSERGLWNPDFRPLNSPIPLLAIRTMVSSDFPFLDSNPEWIAAYLRRFAPSIPAAIRGKLADRLRTGD